MGTSFCIPRKYTPRESTSRVCVNEIQGGSSVSPVGRAGSRLSLSRSCMSSSTRTWIDADKNDTRARASERARVRDARERGKIAREKSVDSRRRDSYDDATAREDDGYDDDEVVLTYLAAYSSAWSWRTSDDASDDD